MAMTSAMDEVMYEKKNFNFDPKQHRHPLWLTERHILYHLLEDDQGDLLIMKSSSGDPIRSPRRLSDITIYKLVSDTKLLQRVTGHLIPVNLYPRMLTEAIYHREARSIECLVSTWPMLWLRVHDMIPLEDFLEDEYLTMPLEGNESTCLADCFILGLLKLKPAARLKFLDFTKFEKDRKLCRELLRLPILWMKPEDRTLDEMHSCMSECLDITKDKVERFLNRIIVVYSNIDMEFKHGNKIEPITILVDMKHNVDDVPIGLSLQQFAPFKFSCQRLWMGNIPDVDLRPSNLPKVLETNRITHFEYEDPLMHQKEDKLMSVVEGLTSLRNLRALSLPSSIDTTANQNMTAILNQSLRKLTYLERLNLAYCNIRGHLEILLDGLQQDFVYLNLRDCRLNEDDMFFLVNWKPVAGLRELNLSCNNLASLDPCIILLLERMSHITCLSVSYCSLSPHSQALIVQECKECSRLKVLCMQSYTPLLGTSIQDLLHICSQIGTLQKAVFFPEAYAFPGSNDEERELNKYRLLKGAYRFLELRGRDDIELED